MAENRLYVALGEEAERGTRESASVGFIPVLSPGIPKMDFGEKKTKEFRGAELQKGDTNVKRTGRRWSGSLEMPFFTEAGGVKGMTGTLMKHFFGKAVSAQNGATGQYTHMMYPVADAFGAANLGGRALTLNLNINEGSVMKNWPYTGARVKGLNFVQEAGNSLKVTADLIGQKRDGATAEIGSPVFAGESLRLDYNCFKLYTGAITRIGTAPDFTGFSFSSAVQIKPDKVSVKIDNGMEDVLRLAGADFPDKTRAGQYRLTLDLTVDWEDPASGFSSVSEFNGWIASSSSTNFCLVWDTGAQAGTGDNHMLIMDVPVAHRLGGEPDYSLDKDPMITLKYEGLQDLNTAKYLVGLMLKNTAATI